MEALAVNSLIAGKIILYSVTTVFLIARLAKNNGVIDIAYGPIIFLAVGGTLIETMNFASLPTIIVASIAVWSTRLGLHTFLQQKDTAEPARYVAYRHTWLQRGTGYFWTRSFIQINLLQGLIIFIVALPGIVALSFANDISLWFAIFGLLTFFAGLTYETIADWQRAQFLRQKKAYRSPIITTGLYAHSRHPHYFGELLVWIGLSITVLPLPFGWLALLSPITLFYIFAHVTGPMLETKLQQIHPEAYEAYVQHTPDALMPITWLRNTLRARVTR